jgi:hypothetical protein
MKQVRRVNDPLLLKTSYDLIKILNMEKRNSLFVVAYFTVGLLGGWLIASSRYHHPRYVDTEYFIELKGDSAVIEGIDRHTYTCPIDSIPVVLERDNL